MPRSQLSSGNGGSCDLGGAGGDGGSGGGDGGSGGVSCGPEAIRRQCSVVIDPGDAALQACKVGMQVSSWLLPPSPASPCYGTTADTSFTLLSLLRV